MAIICSILFLSALGWVRSATDLGPMATVARCRVHCLEETLRETGGQCHEESSCESCWELCYKLMLSTKMYSTICTQPKRCLSCQVVCSFKRNMHNVPENVTKWQFTSKPAVLDYPSTQKVAIGWQQPTPTVPVPGHPAFVYILFTKGESFTSSAQDWTQVDQMSYTDVVLRQDNLPRNPEFWLLAVNRNGTVADVKFNKTSPIIKGVLNIKKDSYKSSGTGAVSVNSALQVNVSVVHDKMKGTISAVIEWEHPPIKLSERDSYTVHWFLDNCEAYEDSPPCDVPADHYAHTIIYKGGKKESYTIEKLLFNALYKVKVELNSKYTGVVEFYTDFCGNVDEETFRICSDVVPAEHSTLSVLTQPQKTPVPYNPLHYSVNILSCQYDVNTKMIEAKFNWTVPFNQSYVISYLVQARNMNMSAGMITNIFPTKNSNITLRLHPYRDYEISVEASYLNDLGEEESLQSNTLVFNTSWVENMPLTLSSQSYYLVKDNKSKLSDAMVIGVTLILIVTLVGLIILFIYKKRHSFKANIIPKTTVAKSNSYKSNVGCKVDYSNQLLVMSDEWELDPRQLKFSSPIGQGAFGKVVTGYYGNEKVAIKLVRDSAPLSYKEDLLAEINLMKRLGSHPNIVSMNGACTLSEPIALVMEYVPYGNLQTFLKKCRLEGEFQRPIGRPSEVTYSLMDSSGGIDSGVITPADMLSFTRQVAMAMEYLSAKKYVHRDLAARNVLLGYDKIVKLCDFGLSRDIFNDNQYHKVTSGKLPLKWMAIESLRDRIFTTQSDVWSFGILMWEIITMGGSPYPNIALADLYYVLANGYRMEKPSNCSDELYIIMRQCWVESPTDRPNFTDLRVQIEMLLSRDRDYLELDNIDVPLSTSESSSVPKSEDSDTQSLISDGMTQHRMTSVPPPLQHTSRNIANMMKGNRISGGGMGATSSASSATNESFDTPVTVVSIEGKSSKERLIGKHNDVDQ